MKRLFLILAILFLAFPVHAQMLQAVVGAGASAAANCTGCNASNDSWFASSSQTYSTDDGLGSTTWIAWQFTTTGTKCITGVKSDLNDQATDRGATAEIWTDSSGSPGSIVAAGYTATVANLENAAVDTEFLFSSCQTLPAGTYWAVTKPVGGVIFIGVASSISGTIKSSTDSGANWGAEAKKFITGVLGCDPQ